MVNGYPGTNMITQGRLNDNFGEIFHWPYLMTKVFPELTSFTIYDYEIKEFRKYQISGPNPVDIEILAEFNGLWKLPVALYKSLFICIPKKDEPECELSAF